MALSAAEERPGRDRARIVDPANPLTALQQRLQHIARDPARRWVNVVENVPCWPVVPESGAVEPHGVLAYAPCEGEAGLLDAVIDREAAVHGLRLCRDGVLITHGAMHAISLIARALAEPGAVALVQAPVFTSVAQMLCAAGFELHLVSHGDLCDGDRLAHLLTPRVRLVYLNSPNNPTGEIIAADDMARLLQLTEARRINVLADLVYDSFSFTAMAVCSPLAVGPTGLSSRIYAVNSASKNYGAPGLRIGWICASPDNILQLAAIHERECVAVSGVSQQVATQLLRRGNRPLVDHVRAGRRRVLDQLRNIPGVHAREPAGGTQLLVELPVADVEAFGDAVLNELGLVLATRSQYEGVTGSVIRLPLGAPPALIDDALQLLHEGLARFAS